MQLYLHRSISICQKSGLSDVKQHILLRPQLDVQVSIHLE